MSQATPLIPTSMVGNYPNPRWWDAQFSRHFTGDRQPPDSLVREALEDAMTAIANDQESAGLDIISDGRLHGDNYADSVLYYYMRQLGYDLYGGQLGIPVYSKLHAGTARQQIKLRGELMVEQARALRRATTKPIKIQYTGVQPLAQCTNDLFYSNARERALDIAKAMNEDILAVDELGVDYIQLDEFTWPYGFEDWAIEAFNTVVDGVKNAKIVTHVCWGNWGGTPGFVGEETPDSDGVFDLSSRKVESYVTMPTHALLPRAYEARANVFNFEGIGRLSLEETGFDLIKEHPVPKDAMFWAGVIDVKSTVTETAEQVAERIRQLLTIVPAEQLGVTTDCGLALLQRYVCQEKLRALAEGAKIVRAELA
uniref:Epoxyalkane coenzyme M transferase n=1 Tax=Alteromonadaceae bacterium PE-TB08W TaxID=1199097 RepID=A0A3G9DSG3_9ALTE|nr:epoxyalkane coenzyme M transferase [Alteromonadaceae bacterium PE-TB08W]